MLQRLLVVALLACLAAPAVSMAQFKQGDWDFTISGTAVNDKDFNTFSLSAQGSVGYFLTDQLELGGRPGVVIDDGGSQYVWNMVAFADWHFDMGQFVPFVGGNFGYQFGGGPVDDGFTAGPEGGVKYFLNGTTYVFGLVSYQFNLNDGFSSGGFVYGLGVGVRL